MTKTGKGRVRTVTISIQWHEDEVEAQNISCNVAPDTSVQGHRPRNEITPIFTSSARTFRRSKTHSGNRLLPTDRLVLNALLSRVPQGEQMTIPVRVQELMTECVISRRQVQICLKRLSYKGLIKRLLDEMEVGGHKGYRYQIL
jgi:hypothetical protein